MKNIIVAQSGGPTVAINSSLLGLYEKAKQLGVKKVYGARFGLAGFLEGKIVDLDEVFSEVDANLLLQTPSSFLGSCRKKIPGFDGTDEANLVYSTILKILKELDVGSFFYIGGNDSMDTVAKLSAYFKMADENIKVIGVPKTIDNDLYGTDHCPGFGSAAKFVATSFLEIERDCAAYCLPAVTIVEVMGRDAGWLTAASALARLNGATGPDLIYCCEQQFSLEKFLIDLKQNVASSLNGNVLVAVSEGLKVENYAANDQCVWFDEFCHKKKAGIAKILEKFVVEQIGCKVRSIELNLLQRCSAHLASVVDLNEAKQVGSFAVELASKGLNGVMVSIIRLGNYPYDVKFSYVEVEGVANKVKKMPPEMFKGDVDVSEQAIDYLKPLIQGELKLKTKNSIPIHLKLQKNFVYVGLNFK